MLVWHLQVRTLKAGAISKDKALAKGAADLAQQHERAVKAERMCSLFCFTQLLSVAGNGWTCFFSNRQNITHWSFCDLVYIKETAQCNHDCCTYSGVHVQGGGVLG